MKSAMRINNQIMSSFKKWNTIPSKVLKTKELRTKGDGTSLFLCLVDDGMEEVPLLVEARVNTVTKDEIRKIAQKRYIEHVGEGNMVEGGCPEIYDIRVEEIGRLGYELIKIKNKQ